MIAVVIASNRHENFLRCETNVAQTIGVPYRLLRVEKVMQGLAAAYNRAAALAADCRFLCFVHDDILFHSTDWGKAVVDFLESSKTGVGGLMGSRYQSLFAAGWRHGGVAAWRMRIRDGAEDGRLLVNNPSQKQTDDVIGLDGAFLCCRRERWEEHFFDEGNFKGFHFYDVDFSLQIHKSGYTNAVLYGIDAEHFSQGKKDETFVSDFIRFQKKWEAYLPQSLDEKTPAEIKNLEGYALAETLALMKAEGLAAAQRRAQLRRYLSVYKSSYHFLRSLYFGFLK